MNVRRSTAVLSLLLLMVVPLSMADSRIPSNPQTYSFTPLTRLSTPLPSVHPQSIEPVIDEVIDEVEKDPPYLPHVIPYLPHNVLKNKPVSRNVTSVKGTKLQPSTEAVRGKASWYCLAGVSSCHYQYPSGSMVAAACGSLRKAMGPHWRGQTVTVTGGSGSVSVVLVDWCGSKDKLIDLYAEPFSRLAALGRGVVLVKVSW